mmetsp:Transcript_8238/g.15283  ORF Transcript_8238/g.15283 Transcript_8238/m.15283 type:complete len:804 (+) Transcript_8238:2158-4569(+)|eukprot:CAMPEP_0203744138 /NCGR_PEP_ID=MMETSP0098-20131031/313_1 /ASSEMBLY_ACC=CAM_ASM_000208 /TAXON_ID=96639 /ORGANISM=" , Strain NY0313808BC1" /LENGTH=803 /DNA_ID=CAMNT_0050631579 /DNA_START=1991 /DNA_END=4402 /DNA_ORIENTATION=-
MARNCKIVLAVLAFAVLSRQCTGLDTVQVISVGSKHGHDRVLNEELTPKESCEKEMGGVFLRDANGFEECKVTHESCKRAGGTVDWMYDEVLKLDIMYCDLGIGDEEWYDEGTYDDDDTTSNPDENSDKYEAPYLEIDPNSIMLDANTYLLPVHVIIKGEAGSQILMVHKRNSEVDCVECLAPPTHESRASGKAKAVQPGKVFTITQPGYHAIRFRAVGPNKHRSEEVFDSLYAESPGADNSDILGPPEDSEMVYIWSEIKFNVTDPEFFDVNSFRMALMEVLNEDLHLSLTMEEVHVIEVKETGVKWEIRVHKDDEARVSNRLKDPVFVYPLAEALYDYGLLQSEDKCTAFKELMFDPESFTSLAATAGISIEVIIGIAGGCVVFLVLSLCLIRCKLKSIKKKEHALSMKESNLSKREKELADQVEKLRVEEQQLLDEKNALDEEAAKLKEEELAAEEELKKFEKDDLMAVDPEAEEEFEREEALIEEQVVQEAKTKLQQLRDKFKQAMDDEGLQSIDQGLTASNVVSLFKQLPKKKLAGPPKTEVGKLRAFGEKLANVADRDSFLKHIDKMVQDGILVEKTDDPEKLKEEFDLAMAQLQDELINKRKAQAEKIAQKRKQRLKVILDDAVQPDETVDPATGEKVPTPRVLEQELEQKLENEFEEQAKLAKETTATKEEYDKAMQELDKTMKQKRQEQLDALRERREKARQKVKENEEKTRAARQAAEAKQKEIAQKVSSVFKKINSVDNKVKNLKDEHAAAQAQLESQKQQEKERQRKKLLERKKKKKGAKVSPTDSTSPRE